MRRRIQQRPGELRRRVPNRVVADRFRRHHRTRRVDLRSRQHTTRKNGARSTDRSRCRHRDRTHAVHRDCFLGGDDRRDRGLQVGLLAGEQLNVSRGHPQRRRVVNHNVLTLHRQRAKVRRDNPTHLVHTRLVGVTGLPDVGDDTGRCVLRNERSTLNRDRSSDHHVDGRVGQVKNPTVDLDGVDDHRKGVAKMHDHADAFRSAISRRIAGMSPRHSS